MAEESKLTVLFVELKKYGNNKMTAEVKIGFPFTPGNTVDEAKSRIESAKTKTGLTVTADIIQKTYETGKKAAKDFMKNLKIKFGDSVPKLNYTIYPVGVI